MGATVVFSCPPPDYFSQHDRRSRGWGRLLRNEQETHGACNCAVACDRLERATNDLGVGRDGQVDREERSQCDLEGVADGHAQRGGVRIPLCLDHARRELRQCPLHDSLC